MNESNVMNTLPTDANGPQVEPAIRTRKATALTSRQAQFLSEVQISLGVHVGELTMTVEQLIDLLPGQAFEFAFDARSTFSLRVGEEEVAKARFVIRDDKPAIEIVEIFSN